MISNEYACMYVGDMLYSTTMHAFTYGEFPDHPKS